MLQKPVYVYPKKYCFYCGAHIHVYENCYMGMNKSFCTERCRRSWIAKSN